MKIYKTRHFFKWAKHEKLSDEALLHTIIEMQRGLVGAQLSSHVYKKRVSLHGRGKRTSSRTIIAYCQNDKAIFLYGYAKSSKDNINAMELKALKSLADELLSYSATQLKLAIKDGELIEVKHETENNS